MRLISLVLFTLVCAAPAFARPLAYVLDGTSSSVGFEVAFGTTPLRGTMPVSAASLVLDFDVVGNSRVDVTLSSRQARMGLPFAVEAMKSPSVLDVARFPSVRFQSTKVRANGEGARVEGLLTVRGVSRPVVLQATIWRQQGTQSGSKDKLTIRLTGALSRAAFGATGWSDMVGDIVNLDIRARIHEDR